MCLVREQLLLGGESGYNSFRRSHLGAGIGAMFPGIAACDCRTTTELGQAVARALRGGGPSVISIELDQVEIPPFANFRQSSAGRSTVDRGASDEDH
jgi:acetolactate synthase-1/2/3 large subunit